MTNNKILFCVLQVMESERMLYLVTEYASGGEIFGKLTYCIYTCTVKLLELQYVITSYQEICNSVLPLPSCYIFSIIL